ncbi:MAG: exonuclease SbcCD subunit D C-terminal domain-containing protein [Bacteroidota bacterium]
MKILHTSDWHLGQRLLQLDRTEEFARALDWLLTTIREQAIDVLVVAGDIFDIGNPPNPARQLYYTFLRRVLLTQCRHVVITGGNHDSPAMLNAPQELLKGFNIHVIGAATRDIADELLVLKNEKDEPELVAAAVPFLRDRDLRTSRAGEDQTDRQARLQAGLTAHYDALAALAQPYADQGIPCLATGHLYAKGAVAAEKQDNIYVGNRENMEGEQFPGVFDYVALGHIHRAQTVGGQSHIRYSGSLVPLSFSETKDEKVVYCLEFAGKTLKNITSLAVPTFRRLKTIEGEVDEVQRKLQAFAARGERELTPWVEVIVHTDTYQPQLDQRLREFVQGMDLELVKIRVHRQYQSLVEKLEDVPDLEYLDVEEVFVQNCQSQGELPAAELEQLTLTFRELQDWMQQEES